MLSCLLSKEAIWKWQVARWRRGSDDDKYLMRSSLNNSSRLEWIIEMMAMNHEEGPDLISLYRNSRDYSCTRLLWKKNSWCVLSFFFFIFLSVELIGHMGKSFWERVSQEWLKGYWLYLCTSKIIVYWMVLYWIVSPKNGLGARICIIFLWILKMRPYQWVTCLDNYPVLCDLLRLLWKLRESFFFCRWVNRCFKQLRKIL